MLNSIAFIPDGNRRYARKHSLSLFEAYERGCQKAEDVFDWCIATPGLKVCTIYALSTENLRRHGLQLRMLTSLYKKHLAELIENKKIHRNNVCVRVIGTPIRALKSVVEDLHTATLSYSKHFLNIALGYGGRAEIVNAARAMVKEGVKAEDINEKTFEKYLLTTQQPDLLVRTSGTQRLSNFLTWQTAYSELYFSDKLWPEFSHNDFNKALEFYNSSKRNFGR